MTCERCYRPLNQGDHGLYKCPLQARRVTAAVWQDTIEGGLEIAHGLCNADGTPRRFDSRSAIKRAAAEKGLVQWSDGYEERSLKDAHVHADWLKSGESQRLRAERVEMRRAGRPDLARQQQRPR
jgi:hypothetical protein